MRDGINLASTVTRFAPSLPRSHRAQLSRSAGVLTAIRRVLATSWSFGSPGIEAIVVTAPEHPGRLRARFTKRRSTLLSTTRHRKHFEDGEGEGTQYVRLYKQADRWRTVLFDVPVLSYQDRRRRGAGQVLGSDQQFGRRVREAAKVPDPIAKLSDRCVLRLA